MKTKHVLTAAAAGFLWLLPAAPAKAQEPEPETWKPIGNGQIRDDILTNEYILSSFYEFETEMQESEQTPGRYRLVNAYKNCPSVGGDPYPEGDVNYLVVDASDPDHVYIEQGGTSYYVGIGQQLCLWSIADDYYNNQYGNWELADEEGVCGKLRDGVITFPPGSVLMVPVEQQVFVPSEHDFSWRIANRNGKFRIQLPGVPYTDVDVSLMGIDSSQTGVNYYVSFDRDVEYALGAVFSGEYTTDMAERIRKTADGTASDSEKVATARIDRSGISLFPYDDDGIHTVVVVPYAKGAPREDSHLTAEWAYSEKEWKNVGKASFTESILSSNELNRYGFTIPPYTYDVVVQQKNDSPWMIRLVDPYGPDCYPYATSLNYDSSRHHYLTFDLGNFNDCMLLYTDDIGLNLGNVGRISLWSYADRSRNNELSPAFVNEYYPGGLPTGKFNSATNELTFANGALNILFGSNPMAWYSANNNGSFSLKLGSDVTVTEAPSAVEEFAGESSDETPVYYTLSGAPVGSDPAPGVYIERRGSKVRKVIIR